VRDLPGVRGAAFTSQLPLSGDFDGYGIRIESRPPADPTAASTDAFRYAVSPGYIEVMGIPPVAGRTFTAADDDRGVRVAIVSEGFARRHLAGLDPLRQRIRIGGSPDAPWREVVGVVGDVRQVSLEDEQVDAVYVPDAQWQFVDATRSLVVRAESAPMALVPGIRAAIWSVNKDQPILRVIDAGSLVRATAAERRFAMVLFQGFAIVALVLAAAGIYGVLIGSVAERTRELGVRAALGASRRDLILMIVRQGMALTTAGIVVGIALALLGSHALTGLLYGVSALDPLTYLAVAAGLALVALLATWVPARRAAGVDPAETLRSE
jgi:putative ABC transport system permease protein